MSVGCPPKNLTNGLGCHFTKTSEKCRIACNTGFTLRGSKHWKCSKDGTWLIDIESYCDEFKQVFVGKKIVENCKKNDMELPSIISGLR